jgi:ParB family transcriptional regulator, chromosome partitioning protein
VIRSQQWKWVEVGLDFPYGHTFGLRQISGDPVEMSDEEIATAKALRGEYDRLEQDHAETGELPEEVDRRLGEIETALADLDERPVKYDPDEIARAGVFISIDGSGELRIERGYIRPEDEPAIPDAQPEHDAESNSIQSASQDAAEAPDVSSPSLEEREDDEEQGIKPIPDRLMTELTAYRTLALRDALAQDPDVAFLAALHALSLKLFYRYTPESCLDLDVKSVVFSGQAPGLNDSAVAKAVDQRHRRWSEHRPR